MMSSPRRSRLRTWLLGSAATLIGLVLALGLAEAMLRVLDLAPTGGLATVTQRDYERLPGIFTPGQRLVDRAVRELPYHITIDSLGYRDLTEMPRLKPTGEVRILMLGDSFTFGYLVDDDKTLPARLEDLLHARCEGSLRVVNAGVGGTSLETATPMAERALPLGIDAAVLVFTENDVTDLATPMWAQLASNRVAKSRFPMSALYPVVRDLALWNLLLEARARWRSRQTPAVPIVRPTASTALADSALLALRSEYKRRLIDLRDRLARANVPLLFAIYPSHLSVYRENSDEQVRWVEKVAHEAGIRTVNLTQALRSDGRPKEQLYLLPYDGHPSPSGYAVVAPAIEDTLLGLPVLANRCKAAGSVSSPAGGVAR